MASNVQKAGAAYEAVLVDRVTGKVDQVIASLGRLENAFKQLNGPANNVADSMKTIGNAMQHMSTRANKSISRMAQWRQMATRLQTGINNAGQAIGQSMMHIGNQMRTTGMLATAAAVGIGAMFFKTAQAVSSFDEQLSRFNITFGKTSSQNLRWVDEFVDKLGRGRTATMSAMSGFRGMFSQMNRPQDQLDNMARVMAQASVDFASFTELSDDEGMTKMFQALAGSMEAVRAYGIDVSEGAVKQFAKDIGLTTTALDQSTKMWLRYELIVKRLKEMNIFGDAERTAGSLANQTKRLLARVEELATGLGQKLKPEFESIMRTANKLNDVFGMLATENIDKIVGAMGLLAGLGGALTVVGTALAMIAPPMMAMAAVAASVIGALVGLSAIATLFSGPIAAGAAVAAAAMASMALSLAYIVASSIDYRRLLKSIGIMANNIGQTFKGLLILIEDAATTGDWVSALQGFKLAGEIVFEEMSLAFYDAMSDAIDRIKSKLFGLALFMSGGAWGDLLLWLKDGDPASKASEKATEQQMSRISALQKQYEKMVKDASDRREKRFAKVANEAAGNRAQFDPYATGRYPEWMRGDGGGGEGGGPPTPNIPDEQIAGRSIGGFSSTFATNAKGFTPALSPLAKIQKNGEDQLKTQQEIAENTRKMADYSANQSETLTFDK